MATDLQTMATKDAFERFFERMNASWGFEGMALSDQEKKLLQLRASGQISQQDYLELIRKL